MLLVTFYFIPHNVYPFFNELRSKKNFVTNDLEMSVFLEEKKSLCVVKIDDDNRESNSVVKKLFWPASSNEDKRSLLTCDILQPEKKKNSLKICWNAVRCRQDRRFSLISLWSLPPHLTLPCCEKWSCENQRDLELSRNRW